MIRIDYTVISGAFPITAELIGSGIPSNVHNISESGYFDGVTEGDYTITFTDNDGCVASEQLQWCDCPEGYIQTGTNCVSYDEVEATYTATTYTILKKTSDSAYSVYGILIFDTWNYNGTGTFEWINDSNTYWRNTPYPSSTGVMNRTCVWGSTTTSNQDIGFSFCINIAISKTYYVGFGCDNWGKIKLNGNYVLEQDLTAVKAMFLSLGMSGGNDDGATFKYWFIYPLTLTAGQNIIEVFGHNRESVAAVGIQIYNATKQDIVSATNLNPLGDKILFSSESLVGETLQYEYSTTGGYHGYSCPEGYALDTCGETVRCVKKIELNCDDLNNV